MISPHKISQTREGSPRLYQYISLAPLIGEIVHFSDRGALEEFHSRPLFVTSNGERKCLSDFLHYHALRGLSSNDSLLLDRTYDRTVEKFTSLPSDSAQKSGQRKRINCRYYFRAFLNHYNQVKKPEWSASQQELEAAKLLQQFVARQLHYSFLECKRNTGPRWKPYRWRCNGEVVRLWFPPFLDSKQRKEWLYGHVNHLMQEESSFQRESIQARIDEYFYGQQPVSTYESFTEKPRFDLWAEHSLTVHGLAHTIAQEKTLKIHEQRPAIKILGGRKLQQLIHRIFQDVSQDDYHMADVAAAFEISASTLTRFAGIRWGKNMTNHNKVAIPDLWRNTARILAQDAAFVETAVEIGLWDQAQRVLDAINQRSDEDVQ